MKWWSIWIILYFGCTWTFLGVIVHCFVLISCGIIKGESCLKFHIKFRTGMTPELKAPITNNSLRDTDYFKRKHYVLKCVNYQLLNFCSITSITVSWVKCCLNSACHSVFTLSFSWSNFWIFSLFAVLQWWFYLSWCILKYLYYFTIYFLYLCSKCIILNWIPAFALCWMMIILTGCRKYSPVFHVVHFYFIFTSTLWFLADYSFYTPVSFQQ